MIIPESWSLSDPFNDERLTGVSSERVDNGNDTLKNNLRRLELAVIFVSTQV